MASTVYKAAKFVPNTYRVTRDSAFIDLYDASGRVGCQAHIDLNDLPDVLGFGRWSRIRSSTGRGYYVRCFRRRMFLHRLLMNAAEDMEVDHINHDTLDCRRTNLRVVTKAQNLQNLRDGARPSRSGVRNVAWNTQKQQWTVQMFVDNKAYYFGHYSSIEEAAQVAQAARKRLMPHLDGLTPPPD